MLTFLDLHSGRLKSRLERIAAQYAKFSGPKWSIGHNTLSEILNKQIPYEVSEGRCGLASKELKNEVNKYMKKHPNFPTYD